MFVRNSLNFLITPFGSSDACGNLNDFHVMFMLINDFYFTLTLELFCIVVWVLFFLTPNIPLWKEGALCSFEENKTTKIGC